MSTPAFQEHPFGYASDSWEMAGSYRDRQFARGLAAYEAFVRQHGHARVPPSYVTPDGLKLGHWVAQRRRAARADKLPLQRLTQLRRLGFTARVAPTSDELWAQGIGALVAFRAEHSHLRIPRTYVSPTGFKLGTWVETRRADYRADRLTAERRMELTELGFIFAPTATNGSAHLNRWEQALVCLDTFITAHGHARVPRLYVDKDGFPLGTWVDSRRSERRRGTLPGWKIEVLDEHDFIWDPRAPEFQPDPRAPEW